MKVKGPGSGQKTSNTSKAKGASSAKIARRSLAH